MEGFQNVSGDHVFGFEKKTIVHVRDESKFSHAPIRKPIYKVNFSKRAVHIYGPGLFSETLLKTVHCQALLPQDFGYRSVTNVVLCILKLSLLVTVSDK